MKLVASWYSWPWIGLAGTALVATSVWIERWHGAWVWPIFLVLVLGLGFLHGALDTVLLTRTAKPLRWSALYLAAVLLLFVVLSAAPGLALLLLLGMSLWHFGESTARHTPQLSLRTVTRGLFFRLALGGASVMLPALWSGAALHDLVVGLLPADAAWVWPVWQGAAWLWLGLACLVLGSCLVRSARRISQPIDQAVSIEIACLAVLNALLAPLMAFALYFGIFHSGMHMRNVWRLGGVRMPLRVALATVLVLLLTVGLFLALLHSFGGAVEPGLAQLWPADLLLRSIVVALAALTLPHGVLVGHFSEQLLGLKNSDTGGALR